MSKRNDERDPRDEAEINLLEIGPDDADDLLEFDDAPQQRASIKVIGFPSP